MIVVLSPAKSLDFTTPPTVAAHTQPDFLDQSQVLVDRLRQLPPPAISELMGVSGALAVLNAERYASWHRPFTPENAKQAILAFNGDVYEGLDAPTLSPAALDFAQAHVRILSGLYGCLRPLDRIRPHRLEMATRLPVEQARDLYAFWSERITPLLNRELDGQAHPVLINLASEEYSRVVRKKQVHATWLDIHFKEESNGRLRSVAVFAKRARGLMTDFCIRNRITAPEGLKRFNGLGYIFRPDLSDDTGWLFTRAT